ncbi:MAG: dethiobiotin synthase [Pseudomonadota bacterium]|nr:dethiobiotin synthase [Pseudomonadota bacterium]MDO7711540.1 dethiobiotin synthase [Pseudomonadota bacterium]
MNSVFVTGTDTDVGKTRISVAIIELLQRQGKRVAAMKPIASGCELTIDGLRNDDAVQLSQQANVDLPYQLINPYAFEPAIAPHIAAGQVNATIEVAVIKQNFDLIQQQSDAVVVEGAGGWLVPINQTQTMADLAISLDLPVILVVDIRLGCINHALLTVTAIESTGLKLQGWIANNFGQNPQSIDIVETLTQRIWAPCLGYVPRLEDNESAADYLVLN